MFVTYNDRQKCIKDKVQGHFSDTNSVIYTEHFGTLTRESVRVLVLPPDMCLFFSFFGLHLINYLSVCLN